MASLTTVFGHLISLTEALLKAFNNIRDTLPRLLRYPVLRIPRGSCCFHCDYLQFLNVLPERELERLGEEWQGRVSCVTPPR